jgi:hypothetical protein
LLLTSVFIGTIGILVITIDGPYQEVTWFLWILLSAGVFFFCFLWFLFLCIYVLISSFVKCFLFLVKIKSCLISILYLVDTAACPWTCSWKYN